MQKVFCFESLQFLFLLYSPLDVSPSFFEKKKLNPKIKPLTPLMFAHVS